MPLRVDDLVARDVAGQPQAHEVGEPEQLGLRIRRRSAEGAVGLGKESGREALVAPRAEGPAAAHGVADAIGERADAGAGHVHLDRVLAAAVVGHDAEVPGFAI